MFKSLPVVSNHSTIFACLGSKAITIGTQHNYLIAYNERLKPEDASYINPAQMQIERRIRDQWDDNYYDVTKLNERWNDEIKAQRKIDVKNAKLANMKNVQNRENAVLEATTSGGELSWFNYFTVRDGNTKLFTSIFEARKDANLSMLVREKLGMNNEMSDDVKTPENDGE